MKSIIIAAVVSGLTVGTTPLPQITCPDGYVLIVNKRMLLECVKRTAISNELEGK